MDMNGFIGKRFNLISKSDIRYVGTLHQINPEDSTIALENVVSHGTEGRRGNPADEIHPSSNVYEYIVFRGSDVKDISIAAEEEEKPAPLTMPDDPAILGSARPPAAQQGAPRSAVGTPQPSAAEGPVPGPIPPNASGPPVPPAWQQQQPPGFPGYYPPFNHRFAPPGFPAPGMPGPYGAPGWYPPVPADAFGGPPPQFPPPPMPMGTTQPPFHTPLAGPPPVPVAQTPSAVQTTVPVTEASEKPASAQQSPAVHKAASAAAPAQPAAPTVSENARATANAMQEASRAASAAVAAAMAKLPPQPGAKPQTTEFAVEAVTKKVADLNTADNERPAQRGFYRGGRGAPRGPGHQQTRRVDVPATDFDFQSANAKFNKRDLAMEAKHDDVAAPAVEIPQVEAPDASGQDGTPPIVPYNKSSFFDNISSESRDREEGTGARHGREWRGEEQRRNFETFGQGSVDSGYRSYRGRGRGRGYGGRGRGYNRGYGGGRGRGGAFRGGRQDFATAPTAPTGQS